MLKFVGPATAAVLLIGCSAQSPKAQCPDPATIAPASIGGAAFVEGLTARLAGPDRENSIAEAISEIHRRAPGLGSTMVTDILIAADCPNAIAKPDHSDAADRARIATFRAEVDQVLGK